jgi:limonene-1,2-epoxide hydrolase
VTQDESTAIADQLLDALAEKDFATLSSLFTDDAQYTDAATPADDVAVGGAEVVLRLGLAFEGVEISTTSRNTVASDNVVMVERVETWEWSTGEQLDLPIATVVEISNKKISRWIDYWDLQTLLSVAPGWWVEQVMKGWKS